MGSSVILLSEAGAGAVPTTEATALNMENLTSAISNVFTVVGNVATEVMSNPVTAMFFVAGLIGLGCGILGRLKHV